MARHGASDYGTAAGTSNKMHRPAILANHILHWISSLIVMSIAAYFISAFSHNTHIIYWVTVGAVDAFLYIPALVLPASNKYKGYMWPLAWIFSYLWLTAFIFASQDYNFGLGCRANSPRFVNKCSLKKTLEAFAFIAFFTNLVGTLLEGRLYDIQRFKAPHNAHEQKYAPGHTAAGTQPVV
jgi:CDP-diglyceride synthetase